MAGAGSGTPSAAISRWCRVRPSAPTVVGAAEARRRADGEAFKKWLDAGCPLPRPACVDRIFPNGDPGDGLPGGGPRAARPLGARSPKSPPIDVNAVYFNLNRGHFQGDLS